MQWSGSHDGWCMLTLVSAGKSHVTEQEVSPQLWHGGHPLQLEGQVK